MKMVSITLGIVFWMSCFTFAQDTITGQGQGLNLKVKAVQDQQVVLEDPETGEQWTLHVGDEVRGWKVISITETLVTLEKVINPSEAIRAQLPVRPLIFSPGSQ